MSDHTLQLADSINKSHYERDFYSHLSMLASVEFVFNSDFAEADKASSFLSRFKFDQRKYIALQQAAFEEAPKIESDETRDVDWKKIDEKVYKFQDRLYEAVNGEPNDEQIKKFTDFSIKCYEKCITYKSMYPQSVSNPWQPAVKILECGRLLYVSDSLNELKNFTNSISNSVNKNNQGNIGIVVKGKPSTIRGFVIDERYDIQKIVYSFLKREAPGHTKPVSLSKIQAYLVQRGHGWAIDAIQIKITTPLKKTGFVGSTGKGFFAIQTVDDLIASYCFHHTKIVSINAIIEQYHVRSREFGEDLQKACGGPTINQID